LTLESLQPLSWRGAGHLQHLGSGVTGGRERRHDQVLRARRGAAAGAAHGVRLPALQRRDRRADRVRPQRGGVRVSA